MRLIVSRQELNALLSKIQNVVSAKPPIPILSNFLLEAVNGELVLTASDLAVGMRCFIPAKIVEEGATTLPAKRLTSLIRELTSSQVELVTGSNEITQVIADSSRFKLHGMSRGEFPALPDTSLATQVKMQQATLRDMLARTAFAVSREDTRYILTGVMMKVSNGLAIFIGTDGKRLGRVSAAFAVDPSFSGNYIIPIKAVEEILKNLGDEGEATLFLMTDKIAVEANNTRIIAKLLTGEYPDVDKVIPEHSATLVTLHREELMTLLRQVSLFTADTSQPIRFTFAEGELQMKAAHSEIGEGKVSMPVHYAGEKLEVAFNPGFFLDILRHTKGESVVLGITDAFNPGVITEHATATDASQPLFVLMPMRLSDE